MMQADGREPPRGVAVDLDGRWCMPVLFGVDARSRAEAESYGVDHNNLTLFGGDLGIDAIMGLWDESGLADLLAELGGQGELPVSLDGEDLDALLGINGSGDVADDAPEEPPEHTVIEVGDVLKMGDHRLWCGDSTNGAAADEFIANDKPLLMIVDPPFDVPYSGWSVPESCRVLMVWGRGEERIRWEPALLDSGWGMHELVFTGGVEGWPQPWFPCTLHNTVHMWRRSAWRIADKVGYDRAVLERCGAGMTVDGRPRSVQEHAGGVLTGFEGMSWGKPVLAMEIAMSYVPAQSVVWDPCARVRFEPNRSREAWPGMARRRESGEVGRADRSPLGEGIRLSCHRVAWSRSDGINPRRTWLFRALVAEASGEDKLLPGANAGAMNRILRIKDFAPMAKRKSGRPRLEFDLRQVEQLAAIMCTDAEMAGVLGCHVDTITERKKEEAFSGALEKGRASGKASLRRLQWNTAKGGSTGMQIWLGKQWLGQRDKLEHTGADGGPIKTEQTIDLSSLSTETLRRIRADLDAE